MSEQITPDPSEREISPRLLLNSYIIETQRRIHLDCATNAGVDPHDSISEKQSNYAWINPRGYPMQLATADAIKILSIERPVREEPFTKIALILYKDGEPLVLDHDVPFLERLEDEEKDTASTGVYLLLTAPGEMPPQLINENLEWVVSKMLEKGEGKLADLDKALQFMQRQGIVHYLNNEECRDFCFLLAQCEPDHESFVEEREDIIEAEQGYR